MTLIKTYSHRLQGYCCNTLAHNTCIVICMYSHRAGRHVQYNMYILYKYIQCKYTELGFQDRWLLCVNAITFIEFFLKSYRSRIISRSIYQIYATIKRFPLWYTYTTIQGHFTQVIFPLVHGTFDYISMSQIRPNVIDECLVVNTLVNLPSNLCGHITL